jgi:uncharacterized protein
MRSNATVEVVDPGRLARQMARHFGHKVEVAAVAGRQIVKLAAGVFELEPHGDLLTISVDAPDAASRLRLEGVCADHLERFAHAPLRIRWHRAD